MIEIFIFKVILSFIFGAAYTLLSTVAADKLGSKIGGLISGLPSTALFGLFFIGWTQSAEASAQATTLMPASLGVSCLFVIAYILLVKRSFWLSISTAYIVWVVAAYALLAMHITNFFVGLVIFFVVYVTSAFLLTRVFHIPAAKGNSIQYSPQLFAVRGLISGGIVAFSVILAKVGGPILGGVMATFPAMATSTLLITYLAHGAAFSASVAKSGFFAWISILIFIIVARYTFVPFGIFWGSVISLAVCYVSAYFLYTYVLKKHK